MDICDIKKPAQGEIANESAQKTDIPVITLVPFNAISDILIGGEPYELVHVCDGLAQKLESARSLLDDAEDEAKDCVLYEQALEIAWVDKHGALTTGQVTVGELAELAWNPDKQAFENREGTSFEFYLSCKWTDAHTLVMRAAG